jgi:hypothetical protein
MTESLAATSSRITPYHRARIVMTLATMVSLLLFYGAARLVGIPRDPGYSVSLLQQSNAGVALAIVLVVLVVSTLTGSVIARSIRRDAGLVTACLGLIALTARGGTIAATLQAAGSPAVFVPTLAMELVVLYGFVVVAYLAMTPLRQSHFLPSDTIRDGVQGDPDEPLGNKLLATAATAIGALILMLLLAQTQDKMQVLASVFLASLIAAAAAHSAFPVEPSLFYWVAPLLVGLAGYAYASASPGTWVIGHAPNPLAAPLPLDYVAAGPPGAIMGYWMSRKWQRAREEHISPPDGPPKMTDAHMPMG